MNLHRQQLTHAGTRHLVILDLAFATGGKLTLVEKMMKMRYGSPVTR